MPKPGDILFYRQFEFEDGSKTDKLFVVLTAPDLEKTCLVLKTTSQPERYQGCDKGCNKLRKCFYVPRTWQSCFRLDTYIQLPEIFEFSALLLLKESIARNIEFLPVPLSSDCFGQLKSCLAGFKNDINQTFWGLIYKIKS